MPVSPISGSEFRSFNKRILHTLRSRGIISAFIFAFALWLYVSLNNTFSLLISVPLEVKTNEDQAIETVLPKSITVEIRGKGWDLFNEKYLLKSIYCLLDISNFPANSTNISYPYTKLVHSLSSTEKFEVKSISPENISFTLSEISKETKPLVSKIEISPRLGFTLVGDVILEPNTVLAKGHYLKLDSIKFFATDSLNIKDAYTDLNGEIPVADTLFPIVKLIPPSVKYFAKIQYDCAQEYRQIPVKVRGGNLSTGMVIQPKYITLLVQGGVEEVSKINPNELFAYVDYEKIINDSTGILIPQIPLPKNIKLLKTDPPYLYMYRYKSGQLF